MNKSSLTGILILTGGILFSTGVLAQSSSELYLCAAETVPPDKRIVACTDLIESGNLPSQALNRIYDYRGISWVPKGDLDRAIADFSEALRLDPKDTYAFNARGITWGIKGDLDRAIADYSEAIRLNPHNANVFGNRGLAWGYKGDYDRAIADYSEAIRLNPHSANVFGNRGLAWGYKGDYDRAIADYSEAIRLNSQFAFAFNNRGLAWIYKGDFDQAIADYSMAIHLNPQFEQAFKSRGLAKFYQSRFDLAAADFTSANRLAPNDAYTVIWLYLARTHSGTNARDDLAHNAKLLPADKWPMPVISLYLGTLKPGDLAVAAANPDPKTQKNQQCDVRLFLGEWYLLQNNVGLAKKLLRDAQADCPKNLGEDQLAAIELKHLQNK